MIRFTASRDELAIISKIADRYLALVERLVGLTDCTKQDVIMDLDAVHSNGCPLRLQSLSPTAGQLLNHFRPRFAQ